MKEIQVHLYSDGGLDISAEGNRLLTCAQLLVKKNNARSLPGVAVHSGAHNWSPLSHSERLLRCGEDDAGQDEVEESTLSPPRTRTVVDCVPDYRPPSAERDVFRCTSFERRGSTGAHRPASNSSAHHPPLRMSSGIMARYAYTHPVLPTIGTATSHCIARNITRGQPSDDNNTYSSRNAFHITNKTTVHKAPQYQFAFPGTAETASLAGLQMLNSSYY